MAFNEKEQQVIKWGLQNGKSKEEVKAAIEKLRLQKVGITQEEQPEQKGFIRDTLGDIKEIGTGIAERAGERADTFGNRGFLGKVAESTGFAGDVVGELAIGVGKTVLPESAERAVKNKAESAIKSVASNEKVQEGINAIAEFRKQNPQLTEALDAVTNTALLGLDVSGLGLAPRFAKQGANLIETGAKNVAESATDALTNVRKLAEGIGANEKVGGITQLTRETAESFKRGVERGSDFVSDATARKVRIAESTPEVAQAIKNNVPDEIIELAQKDEATRRAMKEVLDITEDKRVLGKNTQPSKVSGDLAIEQYNFIEDARKKAGKAIGDEVDTLSKSTSIDMTSAYQRLDDILRDVDINSFSKAQRNKIEELLDLTKEGGETLTPRQVYNKDRLFSQLKRESRLGEIGDIFIETSEGRKSLFDAFRDVFSDTLSEVSPKMKALNTEYAKYRAVVDAIEDTILRGGDKIEGASLITKDPAEFAKVNLRRIMGEGGTTPEFQAVVDAMDEISRRLGYADASPAQIAAFAEELRKYSPDIIPKTGFQGGIRTGVAELAGKILSSGKVSEKDTLKAIRKLLESDSN